SQHGVPESVARQLGSLPPVGTLFAAFLGYNPIRSLLEPTGTLPHLSPGNAQRLTGHEYFPSLISGPFHHGLTIVFGVAIAVTLVAALASLLRGRQYIHQDEPSDVIQTAGFGAGLEDVENAVIPLDESARM